MGNDIQVTHESLNVGVGVGGRAPGPGVRGAGRPETGTDSVGVGFLASGLWSETRRYPVYPPNSPRRRSGRDGGTLVI